MRYDKYRDSGIEWIGEIPQQWDCYKIKFLYNFSMGATILKSDLKKDGKIPVYSATESDTIFGYVNETNVILAENDFVIPARGNSIGHIYLVKHKSTCTQTTIYAKDKKSDIGVPKFVFYFQKGLRKHLFQFDRTAIPQITVEQVKNNLLVIPPKTEQTAIASFLDQKTSEIDDLISNKKKLLKLYEEEKTAIINQAVTKGINPNVNMKDSGVEWLGEIPEHWELKKLKRFSVIKRGASPRPIADPKYFDENGEWSWVRIADVSASERYLKSTTQTLSDLGASLSVKMLPNDFFLSIAGSVGKPIITKIKCCIHDGFVYFPNLKLNSEFLFYIFSTSQPYQGLGKWGTQLNLNTDTVGGISIPKPDKKEITSIVNFLDQKTAEIDKKISKTKKLIELLQEYKTTLISEVVTGKIKVI